MLLCKRGITPSIYYIFSLSGEVSISKAMTHYESTLFNTKAMEFAGRIRQSRFSKCRVFPNLRL